MVVLPAGEPIAQWLSPLKSMSLCMYVGFEETFEPPSHHHRPCWTCFSPSELHSVTIPHPEIAFFEPSVAVPYILKRSHKPGASKRTPKPSYEIITARISTMPDWWDHLLVYVAFFNITTLAYSVNISCLPDNDKDYFMKWYLIVILSLLGWAAVTDLGYYYHQRHGQVQIRERRR